MWLLVVVEKPPYRVPSMEEIAALPWNGYNVVSTFSGCGGSCLGYRMAGYRVKWANEFIPAAQETYKANHPESFLNTDDIREVSPQQVLEESGLERGEIDLLDGSPPCASFSTAGKRQKGWGEIKAYSDTKQRVDDLFFEYVRMIRGLQPKVFVAENVSGLIKGAAKGYFKEIIREMKASGYRVSARLLNAAWLGVPQARERLIFVGVREDLSDSEHVPVHPDPLPYYYTVRDAIGDLSLSEEDRPKYFEKGSKGQILHEWCREHGRIGFDEAHQAVYGKESWFNFSRCDWERPSRTIPQGSLCICHPDEARSLSIPEIKRLSAFLDDFVLTGDFPRQWERVGRSVPPVMMSAIAKKVQTGILDSLSGREAA